MTDTFVVDNSVVMSWCFTDETNKYADAVLIEQITQTAVTIHHGRTDNHDIHSISPLAYKRRSYWLLHRIQHTVYHFLI